MLWIIITPINTVGEKWLFCYFLFFRQHLSSNFRKSWHYFIVGFCHGFGLFEYIMEIGKIFLGLAKSEVRAHIVLHIQKAKPRPRTKANYREKCVCMGFIENSHVFGIPLACIYSKHFWAPDGPQLFVNNNKIDSNREENFGCSASAKILKCIRLIYAHIFWGDE